MARVAPLFDLHSSLTLASTAAERSYNCRTWRAPAATRNGTAQSRPSVCAVIVGGRTSALVTARRGLHPHHRHITTNPPARHRISAPRSLSTRVRHLRFEFSEP